MAAGLRARIEAAHAGNAPPLLLDGAMGTELERRGLDTRLPLWSARALLEAPGEVTAVHREHARAGAGALTTNTFRTQARTLARAGHAGRAAELTSLAVSLARDAAAEVSPAPFVLGCAAPLEDCYHPERVPDDAALAREHGEHALHLARAGVDAILVETMNTAREALAAARAAGEAGVGALVSFVCDPHGRLLSGEPLAGAVAAVREVGAWCVGVNCVPPRTLPACLRALRDAGMPFSVHPNLGTPDARGRIAEPCTPAEFSLHVAAALGAGASMVGGCCGTRAAHVADLHAALEGEGAARTGPPGHKLRHPGP
jgi:S-methylmethionine-dependent homocysteine/selenocysteine methylase